MKTIVIYHSQTGFTKQYAQWIAEATGADCLELSEAKKKNLSDKNIDANGFAAYDAIVYGGWACAGSISKLGWFKSNIDNWRDKKLIAFCVGASPIDSPEIEPSLRQNFNESELKKVHVFYCPGGLNYEKMPVPSKIMMKLFAKTVQAKKDKTEAEQIMASMISSSYDISDRKYIEPILTCLSHENEWL